MYNWKIEFILKSGKEITGYYSGDEDTSGAVANKMLTGNKNSFSGFLNEDSTKHILIKLDEIASATISSER